MQIFFMILCNFFSVFVPRLYRRPVGSVRGRCRGCWHCIGMLSAVWAVLSCIRGHASGRCCRYPGGPVRHVSPDPVRHPVRYPPRIASAGMLSASPGAVRCRHLSASASLRPGDRVRQGTGPGGIPAPDHPPQRTPPPTDPNKKDLHLSVDK